MKKIITSFMVISLFLGIFQHAVVAWEFERPSCYAPIDEREETSITNGDVSLGLGAHINEYIDDSTTYDCDWAILKLVVTSNTRKNVEYTWVGDVFQWHNQLQYSVDNPWNGAWISTLGNPFQFYGGYRSSEYYEVWVSPYGFVSVDGEYWGSPPSSIPSGINPNAFIAAFWRDDLDIDDQSSITYDYVSHFGGVECLCISWNNLWSPGGPGGNGYRHSFQLLLEITSGYDRFYFYSRIWMQYQSIVVDNPVLVGIEDESGELGTTIDSAYLSSGSAFRILPERWGRFVKNLRITITKPGGDVAADVDIDSNPNHANLRGYNVIINTTAQEWEDPTARYAQAFLGTGTLAGPLLATVFFPGVGWVAGLCLLIDGALCAYGLADAIFAAQKQAKALILPGGLHEYDVVNFVNVPAINEGVMDASFCILVNWFFYDNNNQEHELDITATLEYDDVDSHYGYTRYLNTITTEPIHLKFAQDVGNDFDQAKTITPGFYRGCLGGIHILDEGDMYKIMVTPPNTFINLKMTSPLDSDFDLYVYNPNQQLYAASCTRINGHTEYVYFNAYSGYWYIKADHYSGNGIYNLTVSLSPPPGGCPTLFAWNGTHFLEEETLNIHSEPNIDVKFFHWLNNSPTPKHNIYTLKLSEIGEGYNFSESFIDNVQFFIVDENGLWYYCLPILAIHSRYSNVLLKLAFSDDIRVDTLKGDEILLKFLNFWTINPAAFVFVIEGHNPYKT